jgi:putative ATPase subunit gpP of terminase
MTITPRYETRLPDAESSPFSPSEPMFSVRSESQPPVNGYTESEIWNIGQTKPLNQRTSPFSGNPTEMTYLSFFAAGDMHAYWHGRKVRLEGTTTHPAQLRLIFDLLSAHCKPMVYAVKNPDYFRKWSQYAWRVVLDLDKSFKFLITLPKVVNEDILKDDDTFYTALGGFSDAEGFFGLRGRNNGKAAPVFGVSNSNLHLCNDFLTGIRERSFSASVNRMREENGQTQWQLVVSTKDVVSLADRLLLRHEEKVAARNLVRRLVGTPWRRAGPAYQDFRRAIKLGRNACVLAAKREYENRNRMKQIRIQLEQEITRRAHSLYVAGLRPQYIATLLGRSQRTIYRRVAKENDRIQARRKTPKQAD